MKIVTSLSFRGQCREAFEFYARVLGGRITAAYRYGDAPPGMPVAVFTRCDKGAEPADHHSILFASTLGSGGIAGLNHLSWEVRDIDDVHAGSEYLAAKGRRHEWGIGRHLLGSQVFDYWRDPWGHIHEHWTDGDQLDASIPAGEHTPDVALSSQWGPNPPSTFGRTVPPAAS